jgi:hypothetical protein
VAGGRATPAGAAGWARRAGPLAAGRQAARKPAPPRAGAAPPREPVRREVGAGQRPGAAEGEAREVAGRGKGPPPLQCLT